MFIFEIRNEIQFLCSTQIFSYKLFQSGIVAGVFLYLNIFSSLIMRLSSRRWGDMHFAEKKLINAGVSIKNNLFIQYLHHNTKSTLVSKLVFCVLKSKFVLTICTTIIAMHKITPIVAASMFKTIRSCRYTRKVCR